MSMNRDTCTREEWNAYMRVYHAQHPGRTERQRAQEPLRYRERKEQLDALKMAIGCVDCGYRENPLALQFDHVRGVKDRAIAQISTGSLTRLIAELEKCDVRCANCHMIRTHTR